MAQIIEKHKLVCVQGQDVNHNKLYIVELYDNGDVLVKYGRVGKSLQEKLFPGVGRSFMEQKIREKKRGKGDGDSTYIEIDVIDTNGSTTISTSTVAKSELKSIAKTQIEHTDPQVAKLIDYLVDVNRHDIHTATGGQITWNAAAGLFSTPLGIVKQDSIDKARTILDDLANGVVAKQFRNKGFITKLEQYLTLIPQDIGMKFDPEKILPDVTAVQKQGSILDSLEASYKAVMTAPAVHTASKTDVPVTPKIFNVKLILVNESKILDKVRKLYGATRNRNHSCYGLEVKQVYMIEMSDHKAKFEPLAKTIDGLMELWHGTRSYNVCSILKQGLILPGPSNPYITGAMFGNPGIYFSDQSTKSLNYAYGYWDGGGRDRRTFMFLADVAMGKYFVPTGPTNNKPPAGYNSYFAQAHKSGVQNNEMIIFNEFQANLKFLVEFE